MSLSAREKRFLAVGGGVSAIVIGFIFVWPAVSTRLEERGRGGDATERAYAKLKEQIFAAERQAKSMKQIQDKYGVEVPTGSAIEQKDQLVKRIESLAARNKVAVSSLSPKARSGRSRGDRPGDKIAFSVSIACNLSSLAKFLAALERGGPPIVFESIDIKASAGKPDQLRVSLDLYSYVFEGKES